MTDEFKTIKKSRLPDKEIIWMGFLFFLLFCATAFYEWTLFEGMRLRAEIKAYDEVGK